MNSEDQQDYELQDLIAELSSAIPTEYEADMLKLRTLSNASIKMFEDICVAAKIEMSNKIKEYEADVHRLEIITVEEYIDCSECISTAKSYLYRLKRGIFDEMNKCTEAEIAIVNQLVDETQEVTLSQLKEIQADLFNCESAMKDNEIGTEIIAFSVKKGKQFNAMLKGSIAEFKFKIGKSKENLTQFTESTIHRLQERGEKIVRDCKECIEKLK